MDTYSLTALMTLAFGMGIVHAMDADHVMAVTGLCSTHRAGVQKIVAFCLRWAVGHGTVLLLVGSMVYMAGSAIPHELSVWAEAAVGLVLMVLGFWILRDLWKHNTHIHFHTHENLPGHAHWHVHNSGGNKKHSVDQHAHNHGAILVGVLHGLSGSAPLLVLIPLARIESPWLGLAYLGVFSAGVLVCMLIFGGILQFAMQWLARKGGQWVRMLRAIIALNAVGLGSYMLVGLR